MFDRIVPNVPSHDNEYEKARATAYITSVVHCRTLFGNARAEIVSSNYLPCVVQKGCLTLLCFQCSRGFAI